MPPIVQTSYGALQGTEEGGLAVFRGVPFAKPPVGDLRWRPPQEPEPWQGTRDATAFGLAAPQEGGPLAAMLGIIVGEQGEDCLSLNVWTPGLDGKRPVMVWIHGGAFTVGAGSQALYDGQHLSRRGDVVVVTINYRLGVFGFLNAPVLGATGNEGLLDQVAALKWVQQEIANFGGDPENVTIFGESAGAISIGHLLGIAEADGLYQRAILQSGGAGLPSVRTGPSIEDQLLDALKLTRGTAEQARHLPTDVVYKAGLAALAAAASGGVLANPFSPVIGGSTIPQHPVERLKAGVHKDVSIMAGTCRDEMTLFLAADPSLAEMDDAALISRIAPVFPGDAAQGVAAYRAAREARGEPATPKDILIAVMTDAVFRVPDINIAEAQSQHQENVYMYLFDWESPVMGGALKACHALDLGFTFGTYKDDDLPNFYGSGEAADRLSARMIDAWLAFARTGNPATEDLPAWPRYDAETRATMHLGADFHIENAPYDAERAAWAAAG